MEFRIDTQEVINRKLLDRSAPVTTRMHYRVTRIDDGCTMTQTWDEEEAIAEHNRLTDAYRGVTLKQYLEQLALND